MKSIAELSSAILSGNKAERDAAIYEASLSPYNVRKIVVDLTTAKSETDSIPFRIGFPFQSFLVVDATDSIANVNMRLYGRDQQNDMLPLKKGIQVTFPFPINEAYISWAAQAGKTITFIFFVYGEMKTNIFDLQNSGGVSIYDGSSVVTETAGVATTTAAVLFAASTVRKKVFIQNFDSIDVYLGDSAVTDETGTKPGIRVPPGGSYEWRSSSACYIIAGSAGTANKIGLTTFS